MNYPFFHPHFAKTYQIPNWIPYLEHWKKFPESQDLREVQASPHIIPLIQ